jgi:hypothetical protein
MWLKPRQAAEVRPFPWVNFATGLRGVTKVSFLASQPIHTAGQEQPPANGWCAAIKVY